MAKYPIPFGRYQLLERLAIGGMAELFRAQSSGVEGFERVVVIKRILPQLAADERFTAMFINEAKITAKLSHPKIAQTYELGRVGQQLFIAMEYVDGLDALALLRELAHHQEKMAPELAVYIIQEVTDALDFAHNQRGPDGENLGIIHRDVSPSNVLMSVRGDVKLVDFGIAQAVQQEHHTKSGTLKGKYGYMSPEQVVGGEVSARSDIFATGIVLAEMLMGRRLFAAPNELDVLLMVRDVQLGRLERFGEDIPQGLLSIVRQCLRKDPGERFHSAAELRDALADWLFNNRKRIGPKDVAQLVSAYLDQARFRQREALKASGTDTHAGGSIHPDDVPGISVGAPPSAQSSLDIEITDLAELDEAAGGHEDEIDVATLAQESEALREPGDDAAAGGGVVERALADADVADISIPSAVLDQPTAPVARQDDGGDEQAAREPAAAAQGGFFDLGDLDDVDLKSASERSAEASKADEPDKPEASAAAGKAAPAQRAATVSATPSALAEASRGEVSDNVPAEFADQASESIPIVVGEPVATPFQRARPPTTRPPLPDGIRASADADAEAPASEPPSVVQRLKRTESGAPVAAIDPAVSSRYESIEAAVASLALPDPDPSAKDFDDRDITEMPRPSIKKQMRANPPSAIDVKDADTPEPPRFKRISVAAAESGSFRETSPMRVVYERASKKLTGLLVAEAGGTKKEVYFVEGKPEFVSSNVSSELFGNYLVTEGVVSAGELDMALAMMPHYDGKLGDTLVGLGLVRPLDIFRHLTRQVRRKLVDVCTWQQGMYHWYPERLNQTEAFPLDLDPWEVLGAGALELTPIFLQEWIEEHRHDVARRLAGGPDPSLFQVSDFEQVLKRIDGETSVLEHCTRIPDPRERGRFVRLLVLSLNVDLAEL